MCSLHLQPLSQSYNFKDLQFVCDLWISKYKSLYGYTNYITILQCQMSILQYYIAQNNKVYIFMCTMKQAKDLYF